MDNCSYKSSNLSNYNKHIYRNHLQSEYTIKCIYFNDEQQKNKEFCLMCFKNSVLTLIGLGGGGVGGGS